MEWLGRAKIEFTSSTNPMRLKCKDGKSKDLLEICRAAVPPCQLNPLLFNGHLQTAWTGIKSHGPPVHYKRKIFEADRAAFNGSFTVDFVVLADSTLKELSDQSLPPRTTYFNEAELASMNSDDRRPMLVVLHGLTGGSHEVYLRHTIAPLFEGGEWEACVINSRGCAKSTITSRLLYNARATWDTRQVVKWLRKTYPNRPLFGLGFSLGACILVNYLGEEGWETQMKAAVVCANPWNLEVSNVVMRSTFVGREIYQKALGSHLRDLAHIHKADIEKYTNVDLSELFQVKYLYEFDRVYQCATWGYPTEEAYYRDASSVDPLLNVRTPLLTLNALDDPIATHLSLPYSEARHNPFVILVSNIWGHFHLLRTVSECTTSLGGHLGWFEFGGGRWHGKPVSNFLNCMAFEIDLDSIEQKSDDVLSKKPGGVGDFDPMRRKMFVNIQQ